MYRIRADNHIDDDTDDTLNQNTSVKMQTTHNVIKHKEDDAKQRDLKANYFWAGRPGSKDPHWRKRELSMIWPVEVSLIFFLSAPTH